MQGRLSEGPHKASEVAQGIKGAVQARESAPQNYPLTFTYIIFFLPQTYSTNKSVLKRLLRIG